MRAHLWALMLVLVISIAPHAWSVDYVTTVDAPINGTTACGTNDLVRTFNVTDSFNIGDVNLGFQAEHTWRGDMNVRLRSPAGTEVQVIAPNTGAGGNIDNYNVFLDDSAATLINTAPHDTADGTIAPPYENTVRPSNALSAFNNQNSAGTWTLLMCDAFPSADNGSFDIATLQLTASTAPPTGPPLSCPASEQIAFNWGPVGTTNGWAAGSLINGYTIGTSIPMSITVTGNTARLIPRNGVMTPATLTEFTGGGTAQNSLAMYVDFTSQAESLTVTVNVGAPGQGVASVGFDIFDIDRNNWVDRVTVAGSFGGAAVTPSLTGSTANTVTGNQIVGTALAPATSSAANANITFTNAVDQITLTYDNDPSVQANPAPQIMSFFANMRVCPPLVADLSAVKSVEVFDPTNAGLYMTPGREILYKITVTNAATATTAANDIDISDTLPDTLEFISASSTGFSGGTFGSPTLPSANTDCTGGACVVRFAGASLAQGDVGEIIVRALIK
ncbi:proprotein convertase P-domain-containing protein [Litorimonas sp. RW-G-Af-16]|uniref:proprotein convertase P-domain-containing protein n=1 Tax=Litorimonas sp. RW-G-Af-16 TaxID=3241168 RepID=UPI00390C495C